MTGRDECGHSTAEHYRDDNGDVRCRHVDKRANGEVVICSCVNGETWK